MDSTLRIALISGGMYDRLYERIPEFERSAGVKVEIGFRGTHPELNAHLATATANRYDLVSTHSKYAPSQQHLLAALEGVDTSDYFPGALHLAAIGSQLYGIPRNVDLRLLHYRTDLIDFPPATWHELLTIAQRLTHAPELYGFVFPGRGPGLFGVFVELAEAGGARLFPDSLIPEVNNDGGRWAIEMLREMYRGGAVPNEIRDWHYDDVHQCFRAGHAAIVADWPGYYGSYRAADSPVRCRFTVARMPAGPSGRVCCYAGSHTFALTRSGAEKEQARALLGFLTAPQQQALEAGQGSVPVRRSVMDELRGSATASEAERLRLLTQSMQSDLVIPPKLGMYPEIETILAVVVRNAMLGEMNPEEALAEMETRVAECVSHHVA